MVQYCFLQQFPILSSSHRQAPVPSEGFPCEPGRCESCNPFRILQLLCLKRLNIHCSNKSLCFIIAVAFEADVFLYLTFGVKRCAGQRDTDKSPWFARLTKVCHESSNRALGDRASVGDPVAGWIKWSRTLIPCPCASCAANSIRRQTLIAKSATTQSWSPKHHECCRKDNFFTYAQVLL